MPKYGTVLIDYDGETLMCLGVGTGGLEVTQTIGFGWEPFTEAMELRPLYVKFIGQKSDEGARYVVQDED